MTLRASDLADHIGARLIGDDVAVDHVASLDHAEASGLAFIAAKRYRTSLAQTRAGVVILSEEFLPDAPCSALVAENPRLAFARAAALLHPPATPAPGIDPSAVVASDAVVDATAHIGPLCVVESKVRIGPGVEIGPGCVVRTGALIGADTRLVARVVVCEGTLIGERVLLHPGAVVGREGFGFAKDGDRWVRVPQVGRVRIGDDAEIGANSTVDRGAIDDTVIGQGVKVDNLVQIGHNVSLGDNTAIAACSGISGSTRVGRNCTVAGAVGMAGHLQIADDVHFTGMAMVTRSVATPGYYSSGIPAMPSAQWRRSVARFRRQEEMMERIKRLEARVGPDEDAPAD